MNIFKFEIIHKNNSKTIKYFTGNNSFEACDWFDSSGITNYRQVNLFLDNVIIGIKKSFIKKWYT